MVYTVCTFFWSSLTWSVRVQCQLHGGLHLHVVLQDAFAKRFAVVMGLLRRDFDCWLHSCLCYLRWSVLGAASSGIGIAPVLDGVWLLSAPNGALSAPSVAIVWKVIILNIFLRYRETSGLLSLGNYDQTMQTVHTLHILCIIKANLMQTMCKPCNVQTMSKLRTNTKLGFDKQNLLWLTADYSKKMGVRARAKELSKRTVLRDGDSWAVSFLLQASKFRITWSCLKWEKNPAYCLL